MFFKLSDSLTMFKENGCFKSNFKRFMVQLIALGEKKKVLFSDLGDSPRAQLRNARERPSPKEGKV